MGKCVLHLELHAALLFFEHLHKFVKGRVGRTNGSGNGAVPPFYSVVGLGLVLYGRVKAVPQRERKMWLPADSVPSRTPDIGVFEVIEEVLYLGMGAHKGGIGQLFEEAHYLIRGNECQGRQLTDLKGIIRVLAVALP